MMIKKGFKFYIAVVAIAAFVISAAVPLAWAAEQGAGQVAGQVIVANPPESTRPVISQPAPSQAAPAKPAKPVYTAKALALEDGFTEEYTYSFPTGNITVVNNRNQTLLMVNGEFQPYLVEIRENRSLAPLRFVTQAFGAAVDWDGDTGAVTMTLGDTIVTVIIGERYAKVVKDGVESERDLYTEAVIIGERAYIPVRAISEIFDKEAGYESGGIITYNPFVWIDQKTSPWKPDIDGIKASYLKAFNKLKENIDSIDNGAYKDWGDAKKKVYFDYIQQRIENIMIFRDIGRFALVTGPQPVLVERTGAMYFSFGGGSAMEISERALDDPGLLLYGYAMGGFPDESLMEQAYIYGTWDYAHTMTTDAKGKEKPYNIPEFKAAPPYIEIGTDDRVVSVIYESRGEGTLTPMARSNAYLVSDITMRSEGETFSLDDTLLTYDPRSGLLRYQVSGTDASHYFRKRPSVQ